MRKQFGRAAKRLVSDTAGATAIEYGLVAGLISIAIVTALGTLGTNMTAMFVNINNKMN